MSLWRLITRSLLHFRRTNAGVFLAAAVATMILAGALLVGDSVRYSLKRMVRMRLGDTELALVSPNRFFRAALATDLAGRLDAQIAPVLQLRGLMTDSDGTANAPRIQVLGVDERFFALANDDGVAARVAEDGVVLSESLARTLEVDLGEEVLLRIAKPGLMPRDVPLTPDSDLSIGFRLTVTAIAGDSQFARFGLQANQVSPHNAFVPLHWLGEKTEQPGRANLLLAAGAKRNAPDTAKADEALAGCVRLEDLGLEVRTLGEQGFIEVIGRRIFIDDILAKAVIGAGDKPAGVLTYFVNELRLGDKSTPYSFVTAIEAGDAGPVAADMKDDEIVINEWLAEDLQARVDQTISMKYFVAGSAQRLTEESARFRIREIVPIAGPAADGQLMPAFPGLADADDCRDWKPGVAIDLDRIREKDEAYWDMFRGTPKAFVTLAAGQKMWGNRFGALTAVRFSMDTQSAKDIASGILRTVEPASAGLFFQPIRAEAIRAVADATGFGGLFLGLSMFLIASAVILLGLVFVFGVESRSGQSGLLLAVGFAPKLIRRIYMIEGAVIAGAGSVAGVVVALVYTGFLVNALSTVWKGAIGGSVIHFHAGPAGLLGGVVAGMAVSVGAVWLTLRTQLRRPAREFLTDSLQEQFLTPGPQSRGNLALIGGGTCALVALLILFVFGRGQGASAGGAFFAAGALLLAAGLCCVFLVLLWLARAGGGTMRSLGQLALRNTTRRSGRSLAVAALLAGGCFLVISVGVFREAPLQEAYERKSGTGGFALLGETSVPVLGDINQASTRKSLGLDKAELKGVEAVQFRVREGDDASCLNLNRTQRPRLLGVNPDALQQRGAFSFAETMKGATADDWDMLNMDLGEDVVSAIGDAEMIKWMLGKSVGDEVDYTDEAGRQFRLRLVGGLKSSVLQGSLVIAADEFVRRFPSEDGYRLFLIDAPKEAAPAVEKAFSTELADFGLELTPSLRRLGELNAVKNTYLSIFQVLGGLGLILGSAGLGAVVLLNALERRGELGMMRALGFAEKRIRKMVLFEHIMLVVAGLCTGVLAALIAITPAMASRGAALPYPMLTAIIGGIAASAAVWIYLAAGLALRGDLLDAVRDE